MRAGHPLVELQAEVAARADQQLRHRRFANAELGGDLRSGPALEPVERERGALAGGKPAERRDELVGADAEVVGRRRRGLVERDLLRPARGASIAVEADVAGDRDQPLPRLARRVLPYACIALRNVAWVTSSASAGSRTTDNE